MKLHDCTCGSTPVMTTHHVRDEHSASVFWADVRCPGCGKIVRGPVDLSPVEAEQNAVDEWNSLMNWMERVGR